MAFVKTDLAQVGTGGGNSLWIYRTNDTMAVVDGDDYFLLAIASLNYGDAMLVIADLDGTPINYWTSVVVNDGTTITVGDGVTLSASA